MIKVLIGIVIVVLLVVWFKRPPKRVGLEQGAAITLTTQGKVLHGRLNQTQAACSFASQLPMSISFGRSSVDYCATAPQFDQNTKERQFGWHLGDISYVGGWLSIFYSGQHRLPMPMMVIGSIEDEDLQMLKSLGGQVTFKIELDNDLNRTSH